jgi:hypothetical protein
MNKKVLSAGCSFIYGAELSDSPDYAGKDPYSKLTWPALWAKDSNFDYNTVAVCGISNQGISRLVIDYCEKNQVDFVIVQWTYPNRYELRFNNIVENNYFSLNHWLANDLDSEIQDNNFYNFIKIFNKSPMQAIAKIWYNYISYYDTEIYYYLKEIVYLSNYLKLKNIKFAFSSVFHEYYSNISKIKDPSIESLYKISQTLPWVTFNNQGFIEWAASSGHFDREVWQHPNDAAHLAALGLVKNQLNILL